MARKLLIVDDLSANRRILGGMLQSEYEILEAASGQQALDLLERDYSVISAVLLDISMPGMDGYEVLSRVRSNSLLARMPIIMVTGSGDEEARVKSLALGANDFVMKPYGAAVIKHCLKNNIALQEASATVNALRRDSLTGLYSREAFFDKVREMVSAKEPGYYIMSSFDIDKFKMVNDQYGTAKGDDVLQQVAYTFSTGFEPNGGLCCRLSADNFAVIYPAHFMNSKEIENIRLKAANVEGLISPLSFSIGRYIIDDPQMSPSGMYDRAVLAADSIKGRFDENIAFYDETMREKLIREQEIVTEMSDALEENQFEVWFQPQYNHSTDAMIGAEALVRWRHPERGLIPPNDFIPTFEKNGFIYSLDKFVWEQTCKYLRKWLDEGRNPLPVSVNVSRYDLFCDDCVDTIINFLYKYELPIDLLRLEITESAFAESSQHIVEVVRKLVDYGFTVEIDDFGSGYSSLNTLKDVPAQIIKLDMKFLQSTNDSQRGGNIVESVVRMTKWLGMSVIAEGVETIQQADFLRSIGCSYIQGYLYARPMPPDKYELHFSGSDKEKGLLTLETVENLDNNAFWDPDSMDTLIFNSYIGGACIYEYHNGGIELLRATEKYAQVIGSAGMTVEDALKLDWAQHLDEENKKRVINDLEQSISSKGDVTGEYVFLDLPGCPHETYLRSSMRVIASTGERYLVYCTNENITAQRQSEKRERAVTEQLQAIMSNMNGGVTALIVGENSIRQLFTNDRYYQQLGYTKEEYENRFIDPLQIIIDDDKDMVLKRFLAINETGEPDALEYRIIRADGQIRWMRSSITLMDYPGETQPVQLSIIYDITEVVESQQQIQRLSTQMKAIVDNVDLGIIATVVDNGTAKYLFANDRYCEMLGYTRQQFEAEVSTPYLTIADEDKQRIIEETARINKMGETAVMKYTAITRSGEKRDFRGSVATARLAGIDGPVQYSILRDITEELKAERRERRAAEQAQAIMSDISSGITADIIVDDKIEFLFSNERYYQIHGYTRAQFEAEVEDFYKLIHPDDRERIYSETMAAYLSCTPVKQEYRIICRDKSVRWLRADISSTRFTDIEENVHLCIFTDITERKRAEQEIKDTSDQLENILSDMPGGFCRMLVGPDGGIKPVYFNDGLCRLLSMSADEVMAMYSDDAKAGVHPDDVEVVNDVIERMFKYGEASSSRYRLKCGRDEEYIWLSIFGRITSDAQGNNYLNIYYTDATEQVKEEDTQKALLDNLPSGAGVYEFKDGQISLTYQNKSYWELVGLNKADFSDPEPMSAVHPDDISIITMELVSAVEQRRDVICDIRLRHISKGYIPVHLIGRIIPREDNSFLIYATFTPIISEHLSYQQVLPIVLSAIMESTTDLSFVKDTNFRYIAASRPFANMVGYENENMLTGKTDYELFDKEMADKFRGDDESLLASEKAIVDMVEAIPSKDDTPRYSSTSKYILKDASGQVIGLYGVGRDITKAYNQDIQLGLVNDSIPGGLATYVFKMGDYDPKNVKIVYYNDGFCDLFGFTREEYRKRLTSNVESMLFKEDQQILIDAWLDMMKNGTPINCVYRTHVNGENGFKWISHKATIANRQSDRIIITAILQDVTEQRRLIEQLRISQEESDIAVRLGGGIMARYVVAERIMTISPDTAKAYGLPEVISNIPYGPVDNGLISPESAEAYISFFNAIDSGDETATATFRQKFLAQWRWVEAKSSTVFSEDHRPVKAMVSFYDVTDKLEREAIYTKWQQSLRDRAPQSYSLYRCNVSNKSSFDTTEGELLDIKFAPGSFDFNQHTRDYVQQFVFEEDKELFTRFLNADALLANFYRGKRNLSIEYRENRPGGDIRWLRLTADLVDSPYSADVDAYLLFEDIDDMKRAELQTQEMSRTDPLTGVLNRTAFSIKVEQIINASEPDARHALLLLDIDGFKQVNDVFGHAAGDKTLIDIADGLKTMLRHNDLVARLGGDEFLVFLYDILDDSSAAAKAKQICALTRRSFSLEVQISGSVGIAKAPDDGTSFDTLYKKADSALYYVKGSGKDSYAFYHEDLANEHLKPEADSNDKTGMKKAEKRRRMLIVDDNLIDNALMQNIFQDDFIVEKAKSGNSALVRLRHYGNAISVVLLDLMMPGMDGFAVLEKMQASSELQSIPVIIVSGDESRESCLEAIRKGATDYVNKPIDPDILRIRVQSAISKAENQRLRAKNSVLEVQNEERIIYEAALENTGMTFVDYNWHTGDFTYNPSISNYLLGNYNKRKLWHILLSDMVTDTATVQDMQRLVHQVADDRNKSEGGIIVMLKTPKKQTHRFRMNVRKLVNQFQLTNRIIITLTDLDYKE